MQRFWLLLILTFSTVSYSQSFSLGSLVSEMNKNGFIEGIIIDNDNNKEPLPFVDITIKNLQEII
ncbi:MAG: hypothetical protein COB38_08735, partial [Gammaproteobacteria bacterium]